MVKKITSLNIESDVVDKAKAKMLNLSEVAETALRNKIGEIQVGFQEPTECELCNVQGVREKAEDVDPKTNTKSIIKHPNKLVWLYPDEKWICNSCLRRLTKNVRTK